MGSQLARVWPRNQRQKGDWKLSGRPLVQAEIRRLWQRKRRTTYGWFSSRRQPHCSSWSLSSMVCWFCELCCLWDPTIRFISQYKEEISEWRETLLLGWATVIQEMCRWDLPTMYTTGRGAAHTFSLPFYAVWRSPQRPKNSSQSPPDRFLLA